MKKHSAFSLIEISIVILIIGILITGTVKGSRLIYQSRLSSAQNLTVGSSVASIPNLTLWLETTLDGSVTGAVNSSAPEENEALSAWIDRNPQTKDDLKIRPIQATAGYRPKYVAKGIGGLPSIYFDGSNDHFRTISGANTPISAGDDTYTLVAVWKEDSGSTSAGSYIMIEGGSPVATNRVASITINASHTLSGFSGGANNMIANTITALTPYITIITANHTVSTRNVSAFNNTNTPITDTTESPADLDVDNSFFEIGSVNDGATAALKGYISEILVFDRNLKTAEIQEINDYLSKKYGIKLN